jgi:hypothetical protein
MTRTRLATLLALATASAVVVVGVVAAARGPSGASGPSDAELRHIQDRINGELGRLARQGIYVQQTGLPIQRCVSLLVVNPTRPNIEYLRRRFGPHLCFDQPERPGGACAGHGSPDTPGGTVEVPDLRDLGLYEAERRAVQSGLRYTIDCLGVDHTRPRRASRFSPEALVRVTAQCPRAGQHVASGSEIALEAKAVLPGGFPYVVSAFDRPAASASSCARDRSPRGG